MDSLKVPSASDSTAFATSTNRRFWFIHHGRTLPKEGVEAHIEIALALSRGNAEAALSGTERLLRYIASRVGQSSVTA